MSELTRPVELCDPQRPGWLNPAAVGWSREPLHHCNLSRAWLRKKRWNYWAFTTPTHLFSVTVSSLDFAGLAFVYLADLETGAVEEETVVTPFGRGCVLPDRVFEDVSFESSKLRIEMNQHRKANRLRRTSFRVECDDFAGRPL
ncbi:MAG: DUF2804 family protein, partial [bacterium]|nr:DUF2804 family protein [bacterium]